VPAAHTALCTVQPLAVLAPPGDGVAAGLKLPAGQGMQTRSTVGVAGAEKYEPAAHVALCGWHAPVAAVAKVDGVAEGENVPAEQATHTRSAEGVAGAE